MPSDQPFLETVITHYHNNYQRSAKAQDYLCGRGIAEQVVRGHRVGYCKGDAACDGHKRLQR